MLTWLLALASLVLGTVVLYVATKRQSVEDALSTWGAVGLIAAAAAWLGFNAGILPGIAYFLSYGVYFPVSKLEPRWREWMGAPERKIPGRTHELCSAASDALRHAPISPEQKSSIQAQIADVPRNINVSLDKLRRLRKLQNLAMKHEGKADPQLVQMETDLLNAMDAALRLLLSIPKSLMLVETARDERAVGRILVELSDTNQRMLDLAQAHAEISRLLDAQVSTDVARGRAERKRRTGSLQ